jgi:uncharacterized protein (DUF1919 family)
MSIVSNLKSNMKSHNEEKWLESLRKRNHNLEPTIVTNNCIGGVIYHNLGLRFNSPTINLFFNGEDYLEFVKNFEYYINCDLTQIEDSNRPYPVGKLLSKDCEHQEIKLYFQHYKTYEEASQKWVERCKRVKLDNIYYIWEFYDTLCDMNLLKEFDTLPIKKLAITHREFDDIECAKKVSCYIDDKPIAQILQYDGISGKRYLDEIDYVSFLNE